jgi:hypothetical protein
MCCQRTVHLSCPELGIHERTLAHHLDHFGQVLRRARSRGPVAVEPRNVRVDERRVRDVRTDALFLGEESSAQIASSRPRIIVGSIPHAVHLTCVHRTGGMNAIGGCGLLVVARGHAAAADYEARLHAWADGYRAKGRPSHTPLYLLSDYPHMLHRAGDTERLRSIVLDPLRQRALLARSSVDTALSEVELTRRAIKRECPRVLGASAQGREVTG